MDIHEYDPAERPAVAVLFHFEFADEECSDGAEEDFALGVGLGGCELRFEWLVYGGGGKEGAGGAKEIVEEEEVVAHAGVGALTAETTRHICGDERFV